MSDPLTLSQALKVIIQSGGYAPKTIDNFKQNIKSIIHYIGDVDVMSLTVRDVTVLIAKLKKDKTQNTVFETIKGLKSILRFLKDKYEINCLDPNKIKVKRPSSEGWGYLAKTDFNLLVSSFNNTIIDIRNRTICLMLYSTGMRISELISVKWIDIDWSQASCSIISAKSYERRTVYFTNECMQALKQWQGLSEDGEPVFLIGAKSVREFLRVKGKELGINNCHPHAIRKLFATELWLNGATMIDIMRLLGHKNLSNTQRYVISSGARDKEAHNKYIGQNHEVYCVSKTGSIIDWEIKGWVRAGGEIKKIEKAINKAITDALT